MTGPCCLGVSLFTVVETKITHITPDANSKPEIDMPRAKNHTGLKYLADFSPLITLKLAVFINGERDTHLYLRVTC